MRKFLFSILIIFSFSLSAQKINPFSNGYIENMSDNLNLKIEIDNDLLTYIYDSERLTYSIEPNTSLRTSIALNYRFVSLRIGYSPKFLTQSQEETKGKTSVFKIGTDLIINRWMQSLEYSKVKGYFVRELDDPFDLLPGDEGDFYKLPDLTTISVSGRTQYKFNDNFSMKAILRQTEVQRRSAGTLLLGAYYNYLDLRDKNEFQNLNSFGLIFNAGYIYNFVIKDNWNLFLGLSPGLGLEYNKQTLGTGEETENGEKYVDKGVDLVANFYSQVGFSYNTDNFYTGLDFRGYYTTRDDEAIITFKTSRSIFRVYFGYRFNAPKFLKKSVDWVEKKLPY